jgi:hypothetical protein
MVVCHKPHVLQISNAVHKYLSKNSCLVFKAVIKQYKVLYNQLLFKNIAATTTRQSIKYKRTMKDMKACSLFLPVSIHNNCGNIVIIILNCIYIILQYEIINNIKRIVIQRMKIF